MTVVCAATVVVVSGMSAVEEPSGISTEGVTGDTPPLLLESVTGSPPAPAEALSVTRSVEPCPPATVAGVTAVDWRVGSVVPEPFTAAESTLH